MDDARGKVRIGPRMTLSQPMMVVSVTTGGLLWVEPEDFTAAGRLVGFFSPVEVAEPTEVVAFDATLSGAAFITAGVDETDAVATESAFDALPDWHPSASANATPGNATLRAFLTVCAAALDEAWAVYVALSAERAPNAATRISARATPRLVS